MISSPLREAGIDVMDGPGARPAVSDLRPGFSDPVHASQEVFRAILDAMARPGSIHPAPAIARLSEAPAPLHPAAAAILLTIADLETPVWLDHAAASNPDVAWFLKFHTGAPVSADTAKAAFALVTAPAVMPALSAFAAGTDEAPETSATVIVQVDRLSLERRDLVMTLSGPGVVDETRLSADGLPDGWLDWLVENYALFPRGVDVILAAERSLAALPRTTRVSRGER